MTLSVGTKRHRQNAAEAGGRPMTTHIQERPLESTVDGIREWVVDNRSSLHRCGWWVHHRFKRRPARERINQILNILETRGTWMSTLAITQGMGFKATYSTLKYLHYLYSHGLVERMWFVNGKLHTYYWCVVSEKQDTIKKGEQGNETGERNLEHCNLGVFDGSNLRLLDDLE